MTSINVTVFLNHARHSFNGFAAVPGADDLHEAARFTVEESDAATPGQFITVVCEQVFEQLNIDHPTADWALAYRLRGNRSLSVGDVLVLGETAWACASVGWTAISTDALLDALSSR